MYIYRITNKINNKCYIGQTRHSIKRRFGDHVRGCKNNSLIHQAIKKYKKENFEVEQLIECNNLEELDEKEKYFIQVFNSVAPNGYNLEYGGNSQKELSEITKQKIRNTRKRRVVISQHIETGEIVEYSSVLEAEKITKVSQTYIRRCCLGKMYCSKKLRWKYKEDSNFPKCLTPKQKMSRPIKYKCLSTGEIKEFESVRSVAQFGFVRNIVQLVLNGKRKKYNNKLWAYKENAFKE